MHYEILGYSQLKLKSESTDDISVVSSYAQDSICHISSINYDSRDNIFSCLLNRFCFETIDQHDHNGSYFRVNCGLCFHNVLSVKARALHATSEPILNILSISFNEKDKIFNIICSENKLIDIKVSGCMFFIKDFGEPWPTHNKPTHFYEYIEKIQC